MINGRGGKVLRENTLFGPINKIQQAIDRLKVYEPPEGYYLAFSGGKDSITIYKLAELAGVKFDAHYNVTTIDPPELTKFIKNEYPDVNWDRSNKTFLKELVRRGFPNGRKRRWCCHEFKEQGGNDRFVLTGIRWEESVSRSNRKMVETCNKLAGKHYLHPIIDWKESEVWEFIKLNNLKYCELYNKGQKRIGCLFCPMANGESRKQDVINYPKYVKAFIRAFEKRYQYGIDNKLDFSKRWKSGEDMFWWWMQNHREKLNKDQFVLFE